MSVLEFLKSYADIEADLLLMHVLECSREFLVSEPKLSIPTLHLTTLQELAKQRRQGIPLAYLVGYKYFYGLKFHVNNNVLIPRPETEWLVERTLNLIDKQQLGLTSPVKILDTGTGSGCIAISLAKNLSHINTEILGTDISNQALGVAKINAKTHNVDVIFKLSNLFSEVKVHPDIIIANLPYVPVSNYKELLQSLKYEPKLAITDDTDEFVLYKKLFKQLSELKQTPRILLLEIDPKAKGLLDIYSKNLLPQSFSITFHKDFNRLTRYAEICFK